MKQIFQYLLSHMQLAIFLVIVLFSVVGQVLKAARNAKAERERKNLLHRAEYEALRTGRSEEAFEVHGSQARAVPQTANAEPMNPVLAERKRRIEELRRKQATKSGQGTTRAAPATMMARPEQMSPGRTTRVIPPGGLTVGVPAEEARGAGQTAALRPNQSPALGVPPPARATGKQRGAQQQRPKPQATAGVRPKQSAPAPRATPEEYPRIVGSLVSAARDAAASRAVVPGRQDAGPITGRSLIFSGGGSRKDQLRRAVVLGEVFGPAKSAL